MSKLILGIVIILALGIGAYFVFGTEQTAPEGTAPVSESEGIDETIVPGDTQEQTGQLFEPEAVPEDGSETVVQPELEEELSLEQEPDVIPQIEPQEQPEPELPSQTKEFDLTARRWIFEPEIITVNKGDTVKLNITSTDVTHGFAISEFGVNAVLSPGQTKTVEFVADTTGSFSMFCSVICGQGHLDMKGTLVVK